MSSKNLLKGRYTQENQVYHVSICTIDRNQYFKDLYCGRLVVQQIKKLQEDGMIESLAWVIMPDHIHCLFQLQNTITLSDVIKRLKARSALVINRLLNRKGSLWQAGFYDHALRRDEDIKKIARYIIANPLRAGLVKQIGDYALWDATWLK